MREVAVWMGDRVKQACGIHPSSLLVSKFPYFSPILLSIPISFPPPNVIAAYLSHQKIHILGHIQPQHDVQTIQE